MTRAAHGWRSITARAVVASLRSVGWADSEPAWWLNLLAQPDARIDIPGESRRVRGRAADPDERARLWARFDAGPWGDVNAFAARRLRETAIVIVEPAESAKPS